MLAKLELPFVFRSPENLPVKGTTFAIATDSYTVYLLATDKEESTMQTLLSYDVTNTREVVISDVPYRRDCSLACLEGKSGISGKLGHYCQYANVNNFTIGKVMCSNG